MLAIEVLMRDGSAPMLSSEQIETEVLEWLGSTFVYLETNSSIASFGKLSCSHLIESVDIAEASSLSQGSTWQKIDACRLQVWVYSLDKSARPLNLPRTLPPTADDEQITLESMAQVTVLPDRGLRHEWGLLTYDNQIHVTILNHIIGTSIKS